MGAFSASLVLCAGNSPVIAEFPSQRPVARSFDIFFDLSWTDGWIHNRDAGDLRRHRAHYHVTVMIYHSIEILSMQWYNWINILFTISTISTILAFMKGLYRLNQGFPRRQFLSTSIRVSINKNILRHTAHTIVSWPNSKQWLTIHTSDLMMKIR